MFCCGGVDSFMIKSDPTKDPEFQKVVRHFVTTPPKHHSAMKVGKRKPKAGAKANPKQKEMLNIDYENPNAVTMFSATFEQQLQSDAECLSEERRDPR
jgi:hypothetical protein